MSRVGPRSRFNRGRERGGDDATVDVLTGPRSLLLREGREGIAVECGIKVAELPSLPLLSVSCQAPSYMLEGACSQMGREGGKGGSFNHFLDLCLVSLRSRPRLLLHFHHFYSPHFPDRPADRPTSRTTVSPSFPLVGGAKSLAVKATLLARSPARNSYDYPRSSPPRASFAE